MYKIKQFSKLGKVFKESAVDLDGSLGISHY